MLARKAQQQERRYEEKRQPRQGLQPQTGRRTITEHRAMLNVALRRQCFVLVVVISALAMLITARSSMIAARGYELGQIQQSAAMLETENAQLQIEIAKLKSPQRIKDLAAQDFGMSIPTQVYFASEPVSR